jgi:uncharacterized protein YbjQ (UPF0145 family)
MPPAPESRSGGAWDSALSVDGFAAIRTVGFEPVGQVFGAAVYYLATVAGVGCPGTTAAGYPLPGASPEATAGRSLVTGFHGPAARLAQGLYEGRRTAIDRMAGECADLGGHGIVDAVLRVTEIPATSFTPAAIKFTVTGTAVRAVGCPLPARPFASDLSGPDFAKLVMAGWVPAGIALGIAVAGLHDDMPTTSSGPWGTGNAEVPAYAGLVNQVRRDARDRLEQSVRGLGADGVVVSTMTLRVRSDPCHARAAGADYFAEAATTGSAIARFADRNRTAALPSLAVMHLDADARQCGAPRPREPLW